VGRAEGVQSYVPLVAEPFLVGRNAFNEVPDDPTFTDLAQVTALDMDRATFETVEMRLNQARQQNAWLIFFGHEIDHQGGQTVAISVLEKLCQVLSGGDVWVDTVINIGTYIKQKRGNWPLGIKVEYLVTVQAVCVELHVQISPNSKNGKCERIRFKWGLSFQNRSGSLWVD